MTESDIVFPVLSQHRGTLFTVRSLDALTKTTSAALRGGLFDGLRLIDSTGKEVVIESARKIGGVGLFWGFNIFLNQRIRVRLVLRDTGRTHTADEVRALVLRDFKAWHGWQTRDDFEALKEAVEKAATTGEVIRLVASP